MACGGSSTKAPLTGNIAVIPSFPKAQAENRLLIVTLWGSREMLVRFQPGPLDSFVYYCDGRAIEIVVTPKNTARPNVLFVRDIETKMCFVVEAHKVVRLPEGK